MLLDRSLVVELLKVHDPSAKIYRAGQSAWLIHARPDPSYAQPSPLTYLQDIEAEITY